jgi:hypothetical protein
VGILEFFELFVQLFDLTCLTPFLLLLYLYSSLR